MKADARKSKGKGNPFRQRLADLQATAALTKSEIERTERLFVIAERGVDETKPVTTQIEDLLSANHDMDFSSAEIIDIVHGTSENIRRALVRLQERGRIERYESRDGTGWYRMNGWDRLRRRREEGSDE